MNKKDQEIEAKLQELESAVLKESLQPPSTIHKSTEIVAPKKELPAETSVQSDLCYFGGIGLILTGLFMLFNHVRVGTGMLAALGMGSTGFGFVLLPLMIGIGWLIYDAKNKLAWMLTAGSCALIFFSILNSMIMSFPTMTLLGTIMMLAPLAVGGALLLKGIGGPKALEDKLKK